MTASTAFVTVDDSDDEPCDPVALLALRDAEISMMRVQCTGLRARVTALEGHIAETNARVCHMRGVIDWQAARLRCAGLDTNDTETLGVPMPPYGARAPAVKPDAEAERLAVARERLAPPVAQYVCDALLRATRTIVAHEQAIYAHALEVARIRSDAAADRARYEAHLDACRAEAAGLRAVVAECADRDKARTELAELRASIEQAQHIYDGLSGKITSFIGTGTKDHIRAQLRSEIAAEARAAVEAARKAARSEIDADLAALRAALHATHASMVRIRTDAGNMYASLAAMAVSRVTDETHRLRAELLCLLAPYGSAYQNQQPR